MSTDPLPSADRRRLPWPAVGILLALAALALAFLMPSCTGPAF